MVGEERAPKKDDCVLFGGWLDERGEKGGREGGAERMERVVGELLEKLGCGRGPEGEGEGTERELRGRVVNRLAGALLVRCGGYAVGKEWMRELEEKGGGGEWGRKGGEEGEKGKREEKKEKAFCSLCSTLSPCSCPCFEVLYYYFFCL